MPVPWPASARDALVSLLGAGRSAVPVWEALDQADLITRLIPEWAVVRSAPQRNPVHRFTVDRHLVEAAVNAAAYTREVSRPDLLLVGALLHDIGKGQPGDHTDVGIEIVSRLAPRLGFNEPDSEILVDLVRYHLLLPDQATRRDLDDPATVETVVEAVQSVSVLDLLYALTRADATATGPAAWTRWKASLVAELVARARATLAGVPREIPDQFTEEQRALADAPGVAVAIEAGEGAWWITVAADDRVGLLGLIAGAFSVNRLAVRSARTETVGSRAVTMWSVIPEYGDPPPLDRLREDVRLALNGTLDISGKLAARANAYRRRTPIVRPAPSFDVVEGASARATVVEIRAHDRPGLLYLVSTAISRAGVSISAAQVATLGSEIVDVFYLDEAGELLTDEQVNTVRSAVLASLSDSDG